ncbi:hypothetical protein Aple_044610 [Acrocarpospora pleiomorpha]|uniref:Uncharacterized protein n=1 Tax=Acrocarpospora pleiomorpha TaxID=90975 RepID=A0A5M3XJB3_9ACTN|nr:hypothetical protein Aple_044610 [Acrocarpospora pleiomorpha]
MVRQRAERVQRCVPSAQQHPGELDQKGLRQIATEQSETITLPQPTTPQHPRDPIHRADRLIRPKCPALVSENDVAPPTTQSGKRTIDDRDLMNYRLHPDLLHARGACAWTQPSSFLFNQ